jgi:hypothetical protein
LFSKSLAADLQCRKWFAREAANVEIDICKQTVVPLEHVGVKHSGRVVFTQECLFPHAYLATVHMLDPTGKGQSLQGEHRRIEARAIGADT